MKRSIVAMALVVGLALTGCTMFNMDPAQALDPGAPPVVGGTPVTMAMGKTTLSPAGWHLISVLTGCLWGGESAISVTSTFRGETKSLEEAAEARWLYGKIYRYDTVSEIWVKPSVYDNPWLFPFEGFWIYTAVDNLRINFPTEAQFEVVRYIYPQTDAGFWTFVNYCQANWTYQNDAKDDEGFNQLVQGPPVTYARMTGDCDDFATMIAYYTQEYWGRDSFVALLMFTGKAVGHAVAFVAAAPDLVAYWIDLCGPDYPYYHQEGEPYYIPIDQGPGCPDPKWTWDNVDYSRTQFKEWYGVVYERRDFLLNR